MVGFACKEELSEAEHEFKKHVAREAMGEDKGRVTILLFALPAVIRLLDGGHLHFDFVHVNGPDVNIKLQYKLFLQCLQIDSRVRP